MTLANYISDLLYRYECVIVPGFGGFISNSKPAKLDAVNQIVHPPYKQITFNVHVKNNDGLLANYIATVDNIQYKCAINYIRLEIEAWKQKLEIENLNLEGIGSISLVDGKLYFEPQVSINYLMSSFGLSTIAIPAIQREVKIKPVKKLERKEPVLFSTNEGKAPNYLKYAAIFIIGLSVFGFGGKLYRDYQNEQWVVAAKKQQELINEKIENATFVITKPLPTLNLDLPLEKQNYHVIAGAFRFPENATRKLNQLKIEGYKSRILGINKWNLSVVSYQSYTTREEALQNLYLIKRNVEKDAWLLIQKF